MKPRLPIKQSMKDKPTKWGLKNFEHHRLQTVHGEIKGLSFDLVTSMVNEDCDGVALSTVTASTPAQPSSKHLKKQGFRACGTSKQDRVTFSFRKMLCMKDHQELDLVHQGPLSCKFNWRSSSLPLCHRQPCVQWGHAYTGRKMKIAVLRGSP